MNDWRKQLQSVALGTSDAVINALQEDLGHFNKRMTDQEYSTIVFEVQKLVRQTFFTKFVPKTHMDL